MVLFLGFIAKFLVGYAALTISFYMLSFVVPKAAFAARVLAAYMTLIACALYGVVASIVLTLVGKQQIAQWTVARAFHYSMQLTTGVEFVVDDPHNVLNTTRPAVFIGNHQSELDVLMLGAIFPKYCSVTAKAQLKKVPFLGWFMRLSGTIFIDRENSKDARTAMDGAASEIKIKRQSVYMFPEGTRSYAKEPMLLPFKKGAFHLAVQSGVPIVPIVVANYSHVLYVKALVFNSGKIPIKVLPAISTANLTSADVDELTQSTRELMLTELVSLTEKARGHPVPVPASLNGKHTAKSTAVN
ncbi:hypothetical protein V8C35DRAFT_333354 [Trichoderma chlorosporum]